MPYLQCPTHRLYYTVDASGQGPWLTFFHALGVDSDMWSEQYHAFAGIYRILAVDMRGHGRSEQVTGPSSMRDMAQDVVTLWDGLGIERSHVCGLSMGGLIAQALCLHSPTRVARSVISCMSANGGSLDAWTSRMDTVRTHGLASLVMPTLERWFTAPFRQLHPERVAAIGACLQQTSIAGYLAACQAIAATDFTPDLARIQGAVCVIAAEHDVAFPPETLQRFAHALPNACFHCIAGAHMCPLESPTQFNAILADFLG